MSASGIKQPVTSLAEIQQVLNAHKSDVQERYRVQEIGIFGSFARGEQRRGSDVDILVAFKGRHIPGLLKFIEMERFLEQLLKKKVDLVRKGGIRPELRKAILREVVYL
jgi:hypothetical protein